MTMCEDTKITGKDEQRSVKSSGGDELALQVFILSQPVPTEWQAYFDDIFELEPGRLGRKAKAKRQTIHTWGGPKIFDQRDLDHLKKIVAYADKKYREYLKPDDITDTLDFD